MKYCPVCERKYDDDMRICGVDGTPLKSQNPQTAVQDQMVGRVVKGRYQIMSKTRGRWDGDRLSRRAS